MGNSQRTQNSSIIRFSKFGWKPDLPDNRDHVVDFPEHVIDKIEYKISLKKYFTKYYNDNNKGINTSCTVASAINFEEERVSGNKFISSPSFLYYNTRYLENKEEYDSCVGIRDSINCLNKIGICSDESFFTNNINERPTSNVYNEAKQYKGFMYKIIKPCLTQIKACLTLKRPILFGYSVPKQYNDPNWNVTLEPLMPPKSKGKLLGGRTGLIIGYNDEKKILKILDSKGNDWGNEGTFNMHYSMVQKGLCINFCTIEKKVSSESISQLEKPSYSEMTKKKRRKKGKKKKKKTLKQDSVESLSEYESEYEHIEHVSEDTKNEDTKSEDTKSEDIKSDIDNILDEQFPELSDNESNYKEINILTKKKKRRRKKKKKKKKVQEEQEEQEEALKEFAFRTEK